MGTATLRGTPVVIAPGKVFLCGEYAVLAGAPAVLAAIDRHAVAQYVPDLPPESEIVARVVERTVAALGDRARALPAGSALVNTLAFRQGGAKLGLGSSAATAVAACGAVMEMAGVPVADNRDLVWRVADAAHRAAQGGVGSGADVAAAVHGGLLAFTRPAAYEPVVLRLRQPADLELVTFWSGESASTPAMIGAIQAYERRAPVAYRAALEALTDTARRFADMMTTGHSRAVVALADEYGEILDALGRAAAVPIFTPAFVAARDAARELGGTAKPAGAGGGDVGVALFADPTVAAAFALSPPRGLTVLSAAVDPDGVRRRGPKSREVLKQGAPHG